MYVVFTIKNWQKKIMKFLYPKNGTILAASKLSTLRKKRSAHQRQIGIEHSKWCSHGHACKRGAKYYLLKYL